jgi:hypothetical protein
VLTIFEKHRFICSLPKSKDLKIFKLKKIFCIFEKTIKSVEIRIKLDYRKQEAKALLAYLNELPFVKVQNKKPRFNAETEKAIQDAKTGIGLTTVENVVDLFQKLES